jgi:hypothetical protein
MPILDPHEKQRIQWVDSNNGLDDSNWPKGPVRWVPKDDGTWSLMAVGSENGKERRQVIATFHPDIPLEETVLEMNGQPIGPAAQDQEERPPSEDDEEETAQEWIDRQESINSLQTPETDLDQELEEEDTSHQDELSAEEYQAPLAEQEKEAPEATSEEKIPPPQDITAAGSNGHLIREESLLGNKVEASKMALPARSLAEEIMLNNPNIHVT